MLLVLTLLAIALDAASTIYLLKRGFAEANVAIAWLLRLAPMPIVIIVTRAIAMVLTVWGFLVAPVALLYAAAFFWWAVVAWNVWQFVRAQRSKA